HMRVAEPSVARLRDVLAILFHPLPVFQPPLSRAIHRTHNHFPLRSAVATRSNGQTYAPPDFITQRFVQICRMVDCSTVDSHEVIAGFDSSSDRHRTQRDHFRHTQAPAGFIFAAIETQTNATRGRLVHTEWRS